MLDIVNVERRIAALEEIILISNFNGSSFVESYIRLLNVKWELDVFYRACGMEK